MGLFIISLLLTEQLTASRKFSKLEAEASLIPIMSLGSVSEMSHIRLKRRTKNKNSYSKTQFNEFKLSTGWPIKIKLHKFQSYKVPDNASLNLIADSNIWTFRLANEVLFVPEYYQEANKKVKS